MSAKRWGALPVSRIITIMKSSSEAQFIGKDSSYMMTKATELFIRSLAQAAYKNGKHKLEYMHLAEVVHDDDRYEFLRDIMPKKVKVSQLRKLKRTKTTDIQDSSSSDESDSELSDPSSDEN